MLASICANSFGVMLNGVQVCGGKCGYQPLDGVCLAATVSKIHSLSQETTYNFPNALSQKAK